MAEPSPDKSFDPEDQVKAFEAAKAGVRLILNDRRSEAFMVFEDIDPGAYRIAADLAATFLNWEDWRSGELNDVANHVLKRQGWEAAMKKYVFKGTESGELITYKMEERVALADCLAVQAFLEIKGVHFLESKRGSWLLKRAWTLYRLVYEQVIAAYTQLAENTGGFTLDEIDVIVAKSITNRENHIATAGNYAKLYTECTALEILKSLGSSSDADTLKKYTSQIERFQRLSRINENELNPIYDTTRGIFGRGSAVQSPIFGCRHIRLYPQVCNIYLVSNGIPGKKKISGSENPIENLFISLDERECPCFKKDIKSFGKVDINILKRILSSVTLGYGILKLYVGMCYPKMWMENLYLDGNEHSALRALGIARLGEDYRSPMAAFVMLWYFVDFKNKKYIGEDRTYDVEACTKILDSLESDYGESSLFYMFKASVLKLKRQLKEAITFFNLCIDKTSFSEVRFYAMRELAWCHIMSLQYTDAGKLFEDLLSKCDSNKLLHSYMATIALAAAGNGKRAVEGRIEFLYLMDDPKNLHDTDLEKFLIQRVLRFPSELNAKESWVQNQYHWIYLCLEIMYFYENLIYCHPSTLETIITTTMAHEGDDIFAHCEPIIGIRSFIIGVSCAAVLDHMDKNIFDDDAVYSRNYRDYINMALNAFEACKNIRDECKEDEHITGFATYESAKMLMRSKQTREQGIAILNELQTKENMAYAFAENLRLCVIRTLQIKKQTDLLNRYSKTGMSEDDFKVQSRFVYSDLISDEDKFLTYLSAVFKK